VLRHVWRSDTGATQVSGIASYATAFGSADPLPPSATYRNLPTLPFDTVKANDEAAKPKVIQRQRDLLNQRYDLADRPQPGVVMSGGRKEIRPKLCRRSSLDRCPEGSSHIPESEEAALPVRLQ
jgi:hypothetical protein